MYQLTQKAISKIDALRSDGIIRTLATCLDCSENTVNRHIRENVPNGDLTKLAALEVIREATGLGDKQILESVARKEVA
jgi:hypothetical protein